MPGRSIAGPFSAENSHATGLIERARKRLVPCHIAKCRKQFSSSKRARWLAKPSVQPLESREVADNRLPCGAIGFGQSFEFGVQ